MQDRHAVDDKIEHSGAGFQFFSSTEIGRPVLTSSGEPGHPAWESGPRKTDWSNHTKPPASKTAARKRNCWKESCGAGSTI